MNLTACNSEATVLAKFIWARILLILRHSKICNVSVHTVVYFGSNYINFEALKIAV